MRDDLDRNAERLKKALELIANLEQEKTRLKEQLAELRNGDPDVKDMEEQAKPEKSAKAPENLSSTNLESINN